MRNGVRPKREKMLKRVEVEASSGNVFADLAIPDPEECLAKARLVQRIADVITELQIGFSLPSAWRQAVEASR
jgi:hypothetical protein